MTKYTHSLILMGGVLDIKASGHGMADGTGSLTMALEDLHSDMIEGTDQQVFRFDLLQSELETLRDFLNRHIPA